MIADYFLAGSTSVCLPKLGPALTKERIFLMNIQQTTTAIEFDSVGWRSRASRGKEVD
ncbi:hypothetical protein Lepto7375DRAFT_6416 [Leptolyngbya sp. PCC 7375]|nr:hypothetical protein Lepto7375DRAFT_6416 [Leptolyngbya sp. PCC 7375]